MSFVTVASKLPFGLVLEFHNQPERPRVVIRGAAVPYGIPPSGISAGYALTPNVDADFFKEWMAANVNLDCVRRKFVFAHVKEADAAAQAREMTGETTGLEPIDPENPGKGLEKVGA